MAKTNTPLHISQVLTHVLIIEGMLKFSWWKK